MKYSLPVMFALQAIATVAQSAPDMLSAQTGRISVPFNNDWTFNYFPESELPTQQAGVEVDDSTWVAVATPHTWSTFETTGEVHPFIMSASERMDPYWWKGWGVYRKTFFVGPEMDGKILSVEFDGVQKYAEVYLNGHLLGSHRGGYTGFSMDFQDFLYRDGTTPNVLAVLVTNRRDDKFGGIPPMTAGNFNVYGGIYRKVRIVAKDPVHFPYQGASSHEGGLRWETPLVSENRASLVVEGWVRNSREKAVNVQVEVLVRDPEGELVAESAISAEVQPDEIRQVRLPNMAVMNPMLWAPESPNLYSIEARVIEGGEVRDVIFSPLGFRWYRWDYTTNTLIWNGVPIVINGTNRHQEYPWIGDAMPDWMHLRDMEDIRFNLNHNFTRTSHYPQSPEIYEMTDEMGLITVAEVPNIKPLDFSEDVQKENLVEMIRQLRNHPSIFMWSMGNETKDAADSAWAVAEDPTRLLHQRKSTNFGRFVDHNHTHLDMESLLRVTVRGWYNSEVIDHEPVDSPETPKSGQVAGTEDWQHRNARIQDANIRGIVNGQGVAWLYADHGADRIYKNSPLKNVNAKGWVDLYRQPKYMYYLWQANWATEPMIFVRPFYWKTEHMGRKVPIVVDANADEVELLVDGDSFGRKKLGREVYYSATFQDVPVVRGVLTGIAYRMGVEVARHEVRMPGAPAAIRLTASHTTANAGREDLIEIIAAVVDADGIRVAEARPELRWSLEGPGKLVGPSIWRTDFGKTLDDSGCWYIDTPVANLVRTTDSPGTINVSVSADGLATGTLSIRVEPPSDFNFQGLLVPRIEDSGRLSVQRIEGFQQPLALIEALPPMSGNRSFDSANTQDLEDALWKWMLKRHQKPVPDDVLINLLHQQLLEGIRRSSPMLIGDDYNFVVERYNSLRTIENFVGILPLHPEFIKQWTAWLVDEVYRTGKAIPVDEWEQFFRNIPEEGIYVHFTRREDDRDEINSIYRNTEFLYRASGPSVEAVVAHFLPDWNSLDGQIQAEAMDLLMRMNPALNGQQETSLGTEIGIWIPSLDQWLSSITTE